MQVEIRGEPDLSADEFLGLANRVWPRDHDVAGATAALRRTINIVARADGVLVGAVAHSHRRVFLRHRPRHTR